MKTDERTRLEQNLKDRETDWHNALHENRITKKKEEDTFQRYMLAQLAVNTYYKVAIDIK